jgi:glycerophosphoryl diester phosphodiesterase
MTPLVFAHRGSSAALPEHTLDAYRRAIDEGADGLECDVRLTRDGHLICIHDRRLDRTSNGRGLVSAATLDELDSLDFGSWHAGEQAGVLTLDRLIRAALDAKRRLELLIETKHPSRFGGEVERRVLELLAKYDLDQGGPDAPLGVSVMSFSPRAIRRVRLLAPRLPAVFLYEIAPPAARDGRPPFGATVLGPSVNALKARPGMVRRAHAHGRRVYVWTVNTPSEIDLALELGVDGIISDQPAEVLSRLGR